MGLKTLASHWIAHDTMIALTPEMQHVQVGLIKDLLHVN